MSDSRAAMFREEALDYLAKQRGHGELLRVSAVWMDMAFWAFLLLVAVGVCATLLIRIDGEPMLSMLVPALKNLHG
jgi:hypothetical protein